MSKKRRNHSPAFKAIVALAATLIGLIEIPLAPIWAWVLFSEKTSSMVLLGGFLITAVATVYIIGTTKDNKKNKTDAC